MKRSHPFAIIVAAALCFVCESALAKKLMSKRGDWLDVQTKGIVFGTIAETGVAKRANVTYYIQRMDGTKKPEKLESKKGLFAYNLSPGAYEIYSWSLSSSNIEESQDRYRFEVRPGHLTYIGRIVTDVRYEQSSDGKKRLKNLPYVSDHSAYDAALFSEIYPILARYDVIMSVRNNFAWR